MFNIESKYPTDLFFVDVLSVPPPKSRPCQYTGGMMTIHPQSTGLQNVVESITVLKQILQVRKSLNLSVVCSNFRCIFHFYDYFQGQF